MFLAYYLRSALPLFLATAAFGEVHITYPSGGSGCQVVRFPRWAIPKEAHGYHSSSFCCGAKYIFRHAEDSAVDLLLVNVQLTWLFDSNVIVSPDRYWLNLSGVPRVRTASAAEWDSASPVLNIMSPAIPLSPGDNRPIEYAGRSFPKSGKEWVANGLSSRATWLSASSLTALKKTSDDFTIDATTYVDIYHVPTGKLVVSLVGTLSDFDMQNSKTDTGFFLEDRFFVAALSADRRRMLVCDLRRALPTIVK